jgi:hypothetical protein
LGVGFDASRQKLKEDPKLLKEIEKKTRLAIEEEEKTK